MRGERARNWNTAASCSEVAPGVAEAMLEALGSPSLGRSVSATDTNQRVMAIRIRAARMFGFPWPKRVIFTPGATHSLNQVVHGCMQDGQRVLTTELEHNSVLRPLQTRSARGELQVETLAFDSSGVLDLQQLQQRLEKGDVQWLALCLASNVVGTIQPVEAACALARQHGCRVLLDLSQGGGQLEVDLEGWGVSAAALAGHKGLRGPRGIGLLFVAEDVPTVPWVQGGTGVEGSRLDMPEDWPVCMEPGTANLPGIFGLGAALEWLEEHPADLAALRLRLAALEEFLRAQAGIHVHPTKPPDWSMRLGILSFHSEHIPAEVLASLLQQQGVEVRSGWMCAAHATRHLGGGSGLVRLSPDTSATEEEFLRVQSILEEALQMFA